MTGGAVDIGRSVIEAEAAALAALAASLDDGFAAAVARVVGCGGRILLSGVGKSGAVATKIAATLASTATASLVLHPTDALHGDLGQVRAEDVAVLLSHSGETAEIVTLGEQLKARGVWVIALTGRAGSRLAALADLVLELPPATDHGPEGRVPTSSAAAMLALGDALAIAVAGARHVGVAAGVAAFRAAHPAGARGAASFAPAPAHVITIPPDHAPRLDHFVGCLAGADVIVCGLGPSMTTPGLRRMIARDVRRYWCIGVNDLEERAGVVPDFLVVLNDPAQFGARWAAIREHHAPWTFSHLPLSRLVHSRLVPFALGQLGAHQFGDRRCLNYSRDAPFVGACLAVHMGARRIGLLGVDLADEGHELAPELPTIIEHYLRLVRWCEGAGTSVVNLSPQSRIASVPWGAIDDFTPRR